MNVSGGDAQQTRQLVTDMQKAFPQPEYHNMVSSERFQPFQASFDSFLEANSHKHTFAFWSSYCDMVEILLLFLRGTREGNWGLHLASVRSILPWIFAYDHINYSRYLPAYWLEMVDLVNTHPLIHQKCMEGEFAVQRSDMTFAQIACDQTIEQTANRDSKTKGGMTGFTTSKGTVNRWIWSHHARGAITRECEAMAGRGERSTTRADLLPSRMKHDRSDVLRIIETTNAMVNPFDYEEQGSTLAVFRYPEHPRFYDGIPDSPAQ